MNGLTAWILYAELITGFACGMRRVGVDEDMAVERLLRSMHLAGRCQEGTGMVSSGADRRDDPELTSSCPFYTLTSQKPT